MPYPAGTNRDPKRKGLAGNKNPLDKKSKKFYGLPISVVAPFET